MSPDPKEPTFAAYRFYSVFYPINVYKKPLYSKY